MHTLGKYPRRRMRRMRRDDFSRRLMAESSLSPSNLIYPVFLIEGENRVEPIESLPGIYRKSLDRLTEEAEECVRLGISAMALFPVIQASLKTPAAEESFNPDGLIPTAIRTLKA